MDRIYGKELLSFLAIFFVLCGFLPEKVNAQKYPKKIRGYKVQKTNISVKNVGEKTGDEDSEAFVTVREPTVKNVSLTGVTLEISIEMSAVEHSGKVEFLTFKDFRVNGINVDVAEYRNSFKFEKNQKIMLPKPIEIFVGTGQSMLGVLSQIAAPKEEWDVTGTVFVFGKFKKAGFNFKRVIPVPVSIKIKNPVRSNKLPG